MPLARARLTGSLKACGSMIATAMPSTLAAMAVFIAFTISATLLLTDPVHWNWQLNRRAASCAPYCVGTKNGFVVTWLTNVNRHRGWPGYGLARSGARLCAASAVPGFWPSALTTAGIESAVVPSAARRISSRRENPRPGSWSFGNWSMDSSLDMILLLIGDWRH